jgi:cysteinyl-tRNA synthetase
MVYNSLTDSKVPFVPVDGKKVKWYTCGPTVYDVCHMGHARAYLTFDILRRILEDYFHYEVQFAVNITDIDDKIIKRARTNKLLEDYAKSVQEKGLDVVCEDVRKAAQVHLAKLEAKRAELDSQVLDASDRRGVDEREKLLKEQALKAGQAKDIIAAVEAAIKTGSAEQVVAAGTDPLGEHLDAELGHTVTDHSVFDKHARKFERSYLEDMDALGVRRADVQTRVSEYVPEVVEFVKVLISKGFAYASNGSVYFNTTAYKAAGHDYPKLKVGLQTAEASEAEMAEGEGALSNTLSDEKRSASDFALWKSSKKGEPAWESPWGAGRPGWHIECSVMASDVLGNNMDIHAGGSDLRFPHHDNELAQSEACHGCHQWVNYFLHAGHLNIQGLKMSKSLKNFITIRQALKEHTPRQLRLMFLLQAWDKSMLYSDQVHFTFQSVHFTFELAHFTFQAAHLTFQSMFHSAYSTFHSVRLTFQSMFYSVPFKFHSFLFTFQSMFHSLPSTLQSLSH